MNKFHVFLLFAKFCINSTRSMLWRNDLFPNQTRTPLSGLHSFLLKRSKKYFKNCGKNGNVDKWKFKWSRKQ